MRPLVPIMPNLNLRRSIVNFNVCYAFTFYLLFVFLTIIGRIFHVHQIGFDQFFVVGIFATQLWRFSLTFNQLNASFQLFAWITLNFIVYTNLNEWSAIVKLSQRFADVTKWRQTTPAHTHRARSRHSMALTNSCHFRTKSLKIKKIHLIRFVACATLLFRTLRPASLLCKFSRPSTLILFSCVSINFRENITP